MSDSHPAVTAICHCKHCQKLAGSAFSVILRVRRYSLEATGAELKTYEDTGESCQPVFRKFFGNCGFPIMSDVKALPDILYVKAGNIDDATWLKPDIQIWAAHQISCGEVKSDVPKVDGNPPRD